MKMPFDGAFTVTSPYGLRADPFGGGDDWHGGIDLKSDEFGGTVRCVADGLVLRSRLVTDRSDRTWEWGNYVAVEGDDGAVYYYCHLSTRLVAAGERVRAGQSLGRQGSSGRVTGEHLHFEIRRGGTTVNPADALGIENRAGFRVEPESGPDFPPAATVPEKAGWEAEAHPWAREAVAWALGRGILRGDGDGRLRLRDACTREEMAVMLMRCFGRSDG